MNHRGLVTSLWAVKPAKKAADCHCADLHNSPSKCVTFLNHKCIWEEKYPLIANRRIFPRDRRVLHKNKFSWMFLIVKMRGTGYLCIHSTYIYWTVFCAGDWASSWLHSNQQNQHDPSFNEVHSLIWGQTSKKKLELPVWGIPWIPGRLHLNMAQGREISQLVLYNEQNSLESRQPGHGHTGGLTRPGVVLWAVDTGGWGWGGQAPREGTAARSFSGTERSTEFLRAGLPAIRV